jgi:hypothetical protein
MLVAQLQSGIQFEVLDCITDLKDLEVNEREREREIERDRPVHRNIKT